jgi:1-phosphofructokinase family hexose kinase
MADGTPKLLCVSLNPAVDRKIRVPRFELRAVNRASSAEPTAGGKAAHVAYAAKALGTDVTWLAFTGGAEGEFCRRGVEAHSVKAVAVPIAGCTRMTLELIDEASGEITEVLEPGPKIRLAEFQAFNASFAEALRESPMVVLSGSLPSNVEDTTYAELIRTARQHGCKVFLDTSGSALMKGMEMRPTVIKPNRQEAEVLLGRKIETVEDAIAAARNLRGPETVILSLGAEGAVVVSGREALHAKTPPLRAISTVGSGDSFVAGWSVADTRGASLEERLRLAVACGAANCLAAQPGVLALEDVESASRQVEIRRL